jgi:hypothetical protein
MVAAITTLGSVGNFDNDWDSPIAVAVKAAGEALSLRLGAHAGSGPD